MPVEPIYSGKPPCRSGTRQIWKKNAPLVLWQAVRPSHSEYMGDGQALGVLGAWLVEVTEPPRTTLPGRQHYLAGRGSRPFRTMYHPWYLGRYITVALKGRLLSRVDGDDRWES